MMGGMDAVVFTEPAAAVPATEVGLLASRLDTADRRLRELTGHLNVLHAELVAVTTELIELKAAGAWVPDGLHTVELYLGWKAGVAPATARKLVAVAERAHEFPLVIDAFATGALTLDQVAVAMSPRVPATADASISRLAREMTVSQLRRVTNNYSFDDPAHQHNTAQHDAATPTSQATPASDTDDTAGPTDSDANDPAASACADPTSNTPVTSADADDADPTGGNQSGAGFDEGLLGFGFDDLHRFTLHLTGGDPDTGRLIEAALTEARDRLWNDSGAAGEPADVSWIDALRDVCERSLAFDGTTSRTDRYRLHFHLDTNATASDALGWQIPDAIGRYLTCDGLLLPTFVADGLPFSVGRAQHITPLRTRTQVLRRDGGCRVPGCRTTHSLEIHHIIHWDDHGPTDTWNLVALCPRHHRLHHRGQLGITGNADHPDGLRFTNTRGQPIPPSGAKPIPPAEPPPPPTTGWTNPTGERINPHWMTIALQPTTTTARRNVA